MQTKITQAFYKKYWSPDTLKLPRSVQCLKRAQLRQGDLTESEPQKRLRPSYPPRPPPAPAVRPARRPAAPTRCTCPPIPQISDASNSTTDPPRIPRTPPATAPTNATGEGSPPPDRTTHRGRPTAGSPRRRPDRPSHRSPTPRRPWRPVRLHWWRSAPSGASSHLGSTTGRDRPQASSADAPMAAIDASGSLTLPQSPLAGSLEGSSLHFNHRSQTYEQRQNH